jgi:predicted nucleic acid-binding protein
VKLYVDEPGREAVVAAVQRAAAVATVQIGYAEARAALARQAREGGITRAALRTVVRALDGDWGVYNVVEVTHDLVRRAGALAERHALRAYDAVHLAAALDLRQASGDVEFAGFDDRLGAAAAREHLSLTPR